MSNLLYDLGEISGETIFIDGTKIEATANKYTFVRKILSEEGFLLRKTVAYRPKVLLAI